MIEKYWYYVKEDKQEGPVPESKMQEMFDTGLLGPETLVWSQFMTEWTPASKVQSFQVKEAVPSPPPLPRKTPSIPSLEQAKRAQGGTVSHVCPWVRYWARYFDYALFGLVVGVVFGVIAPSMSVPPEISKIIWGLLIVFIWVFVESIFAINLGNYARKMTFENHIARCGKTETNLSQSSQPQFFSLVERVLELVFRLLHL